MQFHPLEIDISVCEKSQKNETTALRVERFSPKIDRHQFL